MAVGKEEKPAKKTEQKKLGVKKRDFDKVLGKLINTRPKRRGEK
jgi:hypothetical protein